MLHFRHNTKANLKEAYYGNISRDRAKLKEAESRTGGSQSSGGDNAIFPFWNMKEGESSTLRFLPDGDESNTFFWKERLMIKLPFAGVKGETDSRPVQVQIPCMEMYGDSCEILNEVRGWFKDPVLKTEGGGGGGSQILEEKIHSPGL